MAVNLEDVALFFDINTDNRFIYKKINDRGYIGVSRLATMLLRQTYDLVLNTLSDFR